MGQTHAVSRITIDEDDDEPPHQHSTLQNKRSVQRFLSLPVQWLREIMYHGLAQRASLAIQLILQSLFFHSPGDGLHPTLNRLLWTVDRLCYHITNVQDVPALTTDNQGYGCHEIPTTYKDGCTLTVAHHTNSKVINSPNQRSDASTVQLPQQALKASALPVKATNAPPLRPVPKPYPTGPHQSRVTHPATQPFGLTFNLCSIELPPTEEATNQPPARPAPKPYPTGPHQSSVKKPNKPPPRPVPKPYPTGPNQR